MRDVIDVYAASQHRSKADLENLVDATRDTPSAWKASMTASLARGGGMTRTTPITASSPIGSRPCGRGLWNGPATSTHVYTLGKIPTTSAPRWGATLGDFLRHGGMPFPDY